VTPQVDPVGEVAELEGHPNHDLPAKEHVLEPLVKADSAFAQRFSIPDLTRGELVRFPLVEFVSVAQVDGDVVNLDVGQLADSFVIDICVVALEPPVQAAE